MEIKPGCVLLWHKNIADSSSILKHWHHVFHVLVILIKQNGVHWFFYKKLSIVLTIFSPVSYIRVSGIRQPCSTSPPLVSSPLLRQPSRGWRELNADFSCKGQRTSQGRFYDPKPSLRGSVTLRLLYLHCLWLYYIEQGFIILRFKIVPF